MQGIVTRLGLVFALALALGAGTSEAAEDSSELGPPPGGGPLLPVAEEPLPPLPVPVPTADAAPVPDEEQAPEPEAPAAPPAEAAEEETPADPALANGFPPPEPCTPCPPPACCPDPCDPPPDPCDAYSTDGTIRRAYEMRVRQSLGHLVMGRTRLSIEGAATLMEDPEGTLGEPVPAATPTYDFGAHEYGLAFGGRLGLRVGMRSTQQLEVRGHWLGEWDDSSTQTGAFGFAPPPGGVSPVSPATLTSEAELWGGDLMWWNQRGCGSCSRWALGIGARLIRFEELARVGDWTPNTGAAAASVEADVQNQFVGLQAGVLYERDISARAMVEITARGFVGIQRMEIDVTDVNVLSGGAHSARLGETEDTFGFDLGVTGRYEISRNLALTASYGLLFVADVQRAAQAMDFGQAATGVVQARKDTDSLLVHSLFVGIQIDL